MSRARSQNAFQKSLSKFNGIKKIRRYSLGISSMKRIWLREWLLSVFLTGVHDRIWCFPKVQVENCFTNTRKVLMFFSKNKLHHVVVILKDWDCTWPNFGLHNTTRGRLLAKVAVFLVFFSLKLPGKYGTSN